MHRLTPLVILTLGLLVTTVAAEAKRAVTLDDAYAIKTVGAVDANRGAELLAFEAEGGLIVQSLAQGNRRIKRLEGNTPVWSPDGSKLAFFSAGAERQLQVWDRGSDRIEQVTRIPGGISPRPFSKWCPSEVSWSPDSRRVVFSTRLIDARQATATSRERDGRRVYDSSFPFDQTPHALDEGIFKRESFWDAFHPDNPDLGRRMKAVDLNPQLGFGKLITADINHRTWAVLPGAARQYACPRWSPDGLRIAAVADISDEYGRTFFGSGSVQATALAIFDLRSNREKHISAPAARIGTPAWGADGNQLAMVAESRPHLQSFTRALLYSLDHDQWSFLSTPGDLPVNEVKWSVDRNTVLVRLVDRFADSLWKLNPKTGDQRLIETFGWHMSFGNNKFSESNNGDVILNVESGRFTGRLVLTTKEGTGRRTLYDANPQVAELQFGEQRRLTWKNKAGEEVDGIVILPPQYKEGHRYPVIVDPYPRPAWDDFNVGTYEDPGQLQAAWGYVILKMQLRAPHAASVWTMTQGENYAERARGAAGIPIMVDDFSSGIEYLVRKGVADPDRIGLFGHSNGGWMTNMLITETPLPRAAVIASGVSNAILAAFFPVPHITRGVDPATNGNVFDNLDDYIKLSPIFRMREIKIPVLLTLGDQDWFWVPQMIAQYGVLRSEGKNVQLVRYSDEGHSLTRRESIEDALRRMKQFFDEHLTEAEGSLSLN